MVGFKIWEFFETWESVRSRAKVHVERVANILKDHMYTTCLYYDFNSHYRLNLETIDKC